MHPDKLCKSEIILDFLTFHIIKIYSWAVILADLCTGEPVDGSVGPVPDVPLWRVLLRHIPPPVAFWSLIFWRGLFRSVPGGPAIFLHIVPMVNDCLFVPLGPRTFDSATLGHYL